MNSLLDTVKICDNPKKELKEILKEAQLNWQEEMKELIKMIKTPEITEEREIAKKEKEDITINNVIMEMKEEFKVQTTQNNIEWERRLEMQKRSDDEWDRRMKVQHVETKATITTMMKTMKEILANHRNNKRKSEETEYNSDMDLDMNTVEDKESHVQLRRKVISSEQTIRDLNEKLDEQGRALMVNSAVLTRTMRKNLENKNE